MRHLALATTLFFLLAGTSLAEESLAPQEPAMSTLDLEWESVDEAEGYELKLTPKQGGDALVFATLESKISQRVPSGTYLLQIRSKEKASGYFGSWSDPTEIDVVAKVVTLLEPADQEIIPEPKEKRHDVTLKWAPIPGVRHYQLRIWDETKEEKAQEFVTANTSKTLKLTTGHTYFWTVTIEDEKSVRYHTTPTPFRFVLLGKQLVPPVIDEKISRSDVSSLAWEVSPDAKTYRVRLEQKFLDESEWRVFRSLPDSKDLKLSFPKLAAGNYRLEVVAEAPHRVSSEPSKFEFTVKPSEGELTEALAQAKIE